MNQTAGITDLATPNSLRDSLPPPFVKALRATDPQAGSISSIQLSGWQRFAQRRILNWLSQIEDGQIELSSVGLDAHSTQRIFGTGSPRCHWFIRSPECYSRLLLGGAMDLAESYMDGQWYSDDLVNLLRILYRNDSGNSHFRAFAADATQRLSRLFERVIGNTIARSRKQISAHYDLSNEFFQLFLDPTMMYSSAYYERPEMTLEQASVAKLEQVCRKLELHSGESVLEIGSGWGGFGLHSVSKYDISLTTTTISRQQFDLAQSRFAAANLQDRIRLVSTDYRELEGQYDKLVSIEMVEAVGERNLDTYFRQCGRLLRPGGRMLIQAIVMPEQRYSAYRRGVDFIQKHVFPGGFLPSVSAIQESVGRTTDLRLHAIEDLSSHYARTLLEWRKNFMNRLSEVRALGFDDRLMRMWEYYLCYCEAAFREQAVRVVQIVWDRPPS